MNANELERIYLLKTEGVDKVVDDINSISDAFERSAKAKASLAAGNNGVGIDNGALTTTNKLLQDLVAGQEDLLDALKNVNVEFSKSGNITKSYSQATNAATDAMSNMSGMAKTLGVNLTSASSGLLKVQSTLNRGSVDDYDSALLTLSEQLLIFQTNIESVKIKFSELRVELNNNSVTSEEYEDRQRELTAELYKNGAALGETVQAMNLLSKTMNPAVPVDYALGVKQVAEANKLLVASADDAIIAQAKLNDMKAGNSSAVKDQRLINAYGSGGNEGLAAAKIDAQEQRTQIELLKQQAIQTSETASYYQKLNAELAILRINFRQLATAEEVYGEEGKAMQTRAATINEELVKLDKGLGNNQRSIGNYGLAIEGLGNITQMFTRQLVRGIGSMVIFGVVFEAISKVSEAVMEAIPGTEAYAAALEKVKQANDALFQSFQNLSTEIAHYTELQDKLNLEQLSPEDQDTIDARLDNTVEGYKRKEEAIKAVGVANGNVFEAEQAQLLASNELRQKELEALIKKGDVITKVDALINQSIGENQSKAGWASGVLGGQDVNDVLRKFNSSDIPDEIKTKISDAIRKGQTDGNISSVMESLRREYAGQDIDNRQEQRTKGADITNAAQESLTKTNALVYSKSIELHEQLMQVDEQYRLLKEKGDIATVDKIVGDVQRKYEQMNDQLMQKAVQYAQTVSNVNLIGEKDAYGVVVKPDWRATYATLPKSLQNPAIGVNNDISAEQQAQIAKDNFIKATLADETFQSSQQTSNAALGQYSADNGFANYGRMASALDDTTAAKKRALDVDRDRREQQLRDEAKTTSFGSANDPNGDTAQAVLDYKIEQLNQEHNRKLIQADAQAYKERLSLGIQYFQRLTENINASSARVIQETDTYTLDRITAVLNGGGSQAAKDKKTTKITNQGTIASADETIRNGTQQLNLLRPQVDEAEANASAAEVSGDTDRVTLANKALNAVLAEQSQLENNIANARNKKAVASQKDPQLQKQLQNGMIEVAQTIANSYMELLAKEDAYRQAMAERSLAWNQKVQGSEVQSKNEQLAEEKANMLAQQQLEKEKAQQDKKRAEQQIIINAVIGASKAIAEDPPPSPGGLIGAGIVMAQAAIQEAFLAQAPAYAQGTTGHPGGFAWVGDGGENELIKFGNQIAISPNTATLTNLPAGAEITPFSKIANVPGNLGAGLRAPSFVTTNSGGSNRQSDMPDYSAAFDAIHATLRTVTKGLANMQVNNDPKKAKAAQLNLSHQSKSI